MGKLVAVIAALAVVASFIVVAHGRDLPLSVELQEGVVNGMVAANYDCNYHFEVQTSWEHGAGTDSMINFELYRSDGSGWVHQESGSGGWNAGKFEQGRLDTFQVNSWCMHPCRLILRSDGTGIGPDWYPSWVRVVVTGGIHDEHIFHVNRWIGPVWQSMSADINDCHNALAMAAEV